MALNFDMRPGLGKKELLNYVGGDDPQVTAAAFVKEHKLQSDANAHDDIVQVILDHITGTGADYAPEARAPSPPEDPPEEADADAAGGHEADVLKQLFDQADTNSDGTLQKAELPLMLKELGMEVSNSEFDVIATTLLASDPAGVALSTLHSFVMGE